MLSFRTLSIFTILAVVIIILAYFSYKISLTWIILPLIIWLLIVSIGAFSMRYNFFLKSITYVNTNNKRVAITFDDGPNVNYTPPVLKLLDKYKAKATFFCIGKHIKNHPEITKSIVEKGHEIGNHSYSHSNFIGFSSRQKWQQEIEKTNTLIHDFTEKETTLFRPPFGVTTPHLAKIIKQKKSEVIGWNIRSFDTALKNKDFVLKRIIKRIKPGSIILLHDTQPNTLYILEHLLRHLQQHHYDAVTINTLLNDY